MGGHLHISELHAWFAKRIVAIGYVVSIAGLIGLVLFAFSVQREEYETDQWVFHTGEAITALEHLQLRITAAESTGRAFLITGDSKFLTGYDALTPLIWDELKRFRGLTSDNEKQQALATELERITARRFETLERQMRIRRDRADLSAVLPLTPQGVAEMQSIEQTMGTMKEVEQQLLAERLSNRHEAQAVVSFAVLISALAGACVLTAVFFYSRHLWNLLQRAEASARELSHQDPLTGLPNRRLLADRLRVAIGHAQRHGLQVGLLCLDLDGFKEINDTFGHDGGDEVLSAVAERLLQTVRREDTVARLGGDEFVVMLVDTDQSGAIRAAEKIIASVGRPYTIRGRWANVATSIGVSLYPPHGADPDALLKSADGALYRAKRAGKSCHALAGLFDDSSEPDRRTAAAASLHESR